MRANSSSHKKRKVGDVKHRRGTSIYRRGGTYWLDVTAAGERFRMSLGVKTWNEAQQAARKKIAEIEAGKVAAKQTDLARIPYDRAREKYLEERRGRIARNTYRLESRATKMFGDYLASSGRAGRPLHRMTEDDIRGFVAARLADGTKASTVNVDVGAIRRMFARARVLRTFVDSDVFDRFKEDASPGRALSVDEQVNLLREAAKGNERWENAALAATLTLNTTMRPKEIRSLQWRDVDFLDRSLTIRRAGTKTEEGARTIELNRDAWTVILELREHARVIGGTKPEHFLFPRNAQKDGGTVDPTRPISGWRAAWQGLAKAAGLPEGFRFYDLRHTAITNLAENPNVSDRTIMDIAGHVSPKMMRRYSHIRKAARRAAFDSLAAGKRVGSEAPASQTPAQSAREEAQAVDSAAPATTGADYKL